MLFKYLLLRYVVMLNYKYGSLIVWKLLCQWQSLLAPPQTPISLGKHNTSKQATLIARKLEFRYRNTFEIVNFDHAIGY